MKTSLVITILNEESTIDWLLKGIEEQLVEPDEIIFVDGGSADRTVQKIKHWQKQQADKQKIRIFQKKGNRSTGRNFGVRKAQYEWIAFTDAGCIPYADWLQALRRTQRTSHATVIAGYYQGLPSSRFEEAVIPYVLVMPERVNPKTFLPATRSMMIHRSVWEQLGGFNQALSHNEDYAFAKKIQAAEIPIAFAADALVAWLPRKKLSDFWTMIFRFALGDTQAGILRPKVVLVFLRYLIFFGLLAWMTVIGELALTGSFFPVLLLLYGIWSVMKNKRYTPNSWLWLPVLQITADTAVMAGSLIGAYGAISRSKSRT